MDNLRISLVFRRDAARPAQRPITQGERHEEDDMASALTALALVWGAALAWRSNRHGGRSAAMLDRAAAELKAGEGAAIAKSMTWNTSNSATAILVFC